MLDPNEPLEGHVFSIEITSTDGRRTVMDSMSINTKRNSIDPQMPSGASILVNMGMMIETPGLKQVHVMLDGVEAKTLNLWVNQAQQKAE